MTPIRSRRCRCRSRLPHGLGPSRPLPARLAWSRPPSLRRRPRPPSSRHGRRSVAQRVQLWVRRHPRKTMPVVSRARFPKKPTSGRLNRRRSTRCPPGLLPRPWTRACRDRRRFRAGAIRSKLRRQPSQSRRLRHRKSHRSRLPPQTPIPSHPLKPPGGTQAPYASRPKRSGPRRPPHRHGRPRSRRLCQHRRPQFRQLRPRRLLCRPPLRPRLRGRPQALQWTGPGPCRSRRGHRGFASVPTGPPTGPRPRNRPRRSRNRWLSRPPNPRPH